MVLKYIMVLIFGPSTTKIYFLTCLLGSRCTLHFDANSHDSLATGFLCPGSLDTEPVEIGLVRSGCGWLKSVMFS